jgi:FixJ family two-component response regulator
MPEITIIDDEVQFAEMLAEVGEMAGYDSLIFTEAREFLDHKKETDVIFLDLTMPDIDGIEVISVLGKRQSKAVLILMSGFDQDLLKTSQRIAEGHGLNVVETLTKPMNISEISELLENLKTTF